MIQSPFFLGGLFETIPKNKMFLHSWVLDKRHFPTSFARFFWEKKRALRTRRLLESAILPGKNVISTRCFLVSANSVEKKALSKFDGKPRDALSTVRFSRAKGIPLQKKAISKFDSTIVLAKASCNHATSFRNRDFPGSSF